MCTSVDAHRSRGLYTCVRYSAPLVSRMYIIYYNIYSHSLVAAGGARSYRGATDDVILCRTRVPNYPTRNVCVCAMFTPCILTINTYPYTRITYYTRLDEGIGLRWARDNGHLSENGGAVKWGSTTGFGFCTALYTLSLNQIYKYQIYRMRDDATAVPNFRWLLQWRLQGDLQPSNQRPIVSLFDFGFSILFHFTGDFIQLLFDINGTFN